MLAIICSPDFLLTDYEVGPIHITTSAAAVPENPAGHRGSSGHATSIKDLDTVARPFHVTGPLLRRCQNDTPLGTDFIQENSGCIGGSASRRSEILCGDQQ